MHPTSIRSSIVHVPVSNPHYNHHCERGLSGFSAITRIVDCPQGTNPPTKTGRSHVKRRKRRMRKIWTHAWMRMILQRPSSRACCGTMELIFHPWSLLWPHSNPNPSPVDTPPAVIERAIVVFGGPPALGRAIVKRRILIQMQLLLSEPFMMIAWWSRSQTLLATRGYGAPRPRYAGPWIWLRLKSVGRSWSSGFSSAPHHLTPPGHLVYTRWLSCEVQATL